MDYVLVVEPDESERSRLEEIIKSAGSAFPYKIIADAEDAIDILENQSVDVLISEMKLPVISGKELFALAKMISPETVRIVLTDPENVNEIIAFINEGDLFKLIMKPCASAADFCEPLQAALEYSAMKKRAKKDLEQANLDIFYSEEDYEKMDKNCQKNSELYSKTVDVVMTMIEKYLTKKEGGAVGQFMEKSYCNELFSYFLLTMVNGNGNYLVGYNLLMNEFSNDVKHRVFTMQKQNDCEINPEIFRKITFLLMTLSNACKHLLERYKISVTIENGADKFYIVRFSCDYSENVDENGKLHYLDVSSLVRKDIMDLTQKITDSLVYRAVSIEQEHEYVLNCAIERE